MYGWGPEKVSAMTVDQQMIYIVGSGSKMLTGDDAKIYVDGVLKASGEEINAPVTGDASGALHNGRTTSGSFHLKGDKAETLIYKRALPDSERLQVRNYLTKKFAL